MRALPYRQFCVSHRMPMPRRLFKSLSRQRHLWDQRWFMRPFKLLLGNPAYWSLNRRNVTRAFALGLLMAFAPIPGHMVFAGLLALALRLNVPAAITGTLLVNPFTMVPIYVYCYRLGRMLLDLPPRRFTVEMSWDWLTHGLLPIWKPFLLGCAVMGTVTAIAGYITLGGLWHLQLVLSYHKRKEKRSDAAQLAERAEPVASEALPEIREPAAVESQVETKVDTPAATHSAVPDAASRRKSGS